MKHKKFRLALQISVEMVFWVRKCYIITCFSMIWLVLDYISRGFDFPVLHPNHFYIDFQ